MLIGLDGQPIPSTIVDEGMEAQVNELIGGLEKTIWNMIQQKLTRDLKPLRGKLSEEVIQKIAELVVTRVAMRIDAQLGILHPENVPDDSTNDIQGTEETTESCEQIDVEKQLKGVELR